MDSYAGTMYKHCYAKFKKTVHVKSGTKTIKYPVKINSISLKTSSKKKQNKFQKTENNYPKIKYISSY